MAQYITGSINTTAGSSVVTGLGTAWVTAGIAAGAILLVEDDPTPYVVAQVDSETQLQVSANQPRTLADYDYSLTTSFTPNRNYPLLSAGDIQAADVLAEAMRRIDADLATVLGGDNSKILLGPGTRIEFDGTNMVFYVNDAPVLKLP